MPPVSRFACLALPLGLVAALSMAAQGPGDPPPAEGGFVGDQTCKVCHNTAEKERRWDTWMNTRHADALETLKTAWSAEIAKARGITVPAWEAPACLKCHVTGHDGLKAAPPARIAPAGGIQCETCHGPGENHVRDAQRYWVEKEPGVDPSARIDFPDRSNCLQCHNTDSPTWDPSRYALPDGTTAGFDYAQAKKRAIHPESDARPESKPAPAR